MYYLHLYLRSKLVVVLKFTKKTLNLYINKGASKFSKSHFFEKMKTKYFGSSLYTVNYMLSGKLIVSLCTIIPFSYITRLKNTRKNS